MTQRSRSASILTPPPQHIFIELSATARIPGYYSVHGKPSSLLCNADHAPICCIWGRLENVRVNIKYGLVSFQGSFLVFLKGQGLQAHVCNYSITGAALCKTRSNTEGVGSNPTRGMDICVFLFCVCVVVCIGS
jgi:hypothetical protein